MSEVEDRVANGVAFLDKQNPGWDEKIFVSQLIMQDCNQCILGQLYSEYNYGCEVLGIDNVEEAPAYGFELDTWASSNLSHKDLEEEWIRVINLRREKLLEDILVKEDKVPVVA